MCLIIMDFMIPTMFPDAEGNLIGTKKVKKKKKKGADEDGEFTVFNKLTDYSLW